MSPEQNPKVKPEQLDSSRLDEKNLVTPAPKHQDDFHEKFDNITEGYDSRTGTIPPNERDDRHLKTDDEPEHTGLSGFQKIGLGAAGLAAVIGAAVGGKAAFGGDNENTAPRGETTTSAPVTPVEKTAPSPTETTDFTLTAEKYTNNPELIMTDFVSAYNEWTNTGYTKKAANADIRYTMSVEEYAQQLNQESDDTFANEVLASDWQNNAEIAGWFDTSKSLHITNTAVALKTEVGGSNSDDKVEYKRYIDLDSRSIVVDSSSPDKIIVSAAWKGRDNRDQNRAGDIITNFNPNEEHGSYTLTFVRTEGSMKLTGVAY